MVENNLLQKDYSYLIDEICTGKKSPDIIRRMIPILIGWAKRGYMQKTYGDLIKALGYTRFSGIGNCLGKLQLVINKLCEVTGENIPSLNALVNNKDGLPSDGFSFVLDGYDTLSDKDKKEIARMYNETAISFQKWDWVLAQLGLKPYFSKDDENAILSGNIHGYGGEHEEHKKLKQYIAANPKSIGIETDEQGETEFTLLSGDILDVYFKKAHIAVEVKPSTSPDSDILRGIYQCIKYKAVLDATEAVHGNKPIDHCVLVIAGSLSESNFNVKNCLNINVIENFKI